MAQATHDGGNLFLDIKGFEKCHNIQVDFAKDISKDQYAWLPSGVNSLRSVGGDQQSEALLALPDTPFRRPIPATKGTIWIYIQAHTPDFAYGDKLVSVWSAERNDYVCNAYRDEVFKGHSEWAPHPNGWPWMTEGVAAFRWSRVRFQATEMRDIETKARSDTPFEPVLIKNLDPRDLRKDHIRYDRGDYMFRNYRAIDNVFDDDITTKHAVETSLTVTVKQHQGLGIVLLFYDADNYYTSTSYENSCRKKTVTNLPCFAENGVRSFRKLPYTSPYGVYPDLKDSWQFFELFAGMVIHECIISDQSTVLSEISHSMDKIERALAHDKNLRVHQPRWKTKILLWKNHLHHIRIHFQQMQSMMNPEKRLFQCRQLQEMSDTVAGMHQRLDSLYQTMMTTMSIVESDRAIREAEEVNKLTSLAFFFIPLSFASSVFGMNIVEFGDTKAWIWAVTSAVILLTTYLLLYRREVVQMASQLPQYLDVGWRAIRLLMYIYLWPYVLYLRSTAPTDSQEVELEPDRETDATGSIV